MQGSKGKPIVVFLLLVTAALLSYFIFFVPNEGVTTQRASDISITSLASQPSPPVQSVLEANQPIIAGSVQTVSKVTAYKSSAGIEASFLGRFLGFNSSTADANGWRCPVGSPADPFQSGLAALTGAPNCGVLLRNLCLKDSKPFVFVDEGTEGAQRRPGGGATVGEDGKVLSPYHLGPGGAISLCNEGSKSKGRFHMVEHLPTSYTSWMVPNLRKQREEWAEKGQLPPGTTRSNFEGCDGKVLVAPFCWELYGYHLMLCLMATHAHLERLGLRRYLEAHKGSSVTVAISKSSKAFPYMVGSATSWHVAERPGAANMPSRAHPSGYWRLWQVLADKPSDVFPDSDVPAQCYRLAILGAPASFTVSAAEGQAFRLAVIQRLQLEVISSKASKGTASLVISHSDEATLTTPGALIACAKYRVTLIERKKQYKIINLPELEGQIKTALGSRQGNSSSGRILSFRTAILEDMNLEEQMALAVNTDLFVAVHGNGLTWTALMPPGGAFIELWPNYPYNANYLKFAERHALFRETVQAKADCKNRCPASYTIPTAVFEAVINHLDTVSCKPRGQHKPGEGD